MGGKVLIVLWRWCIFCYILFKKVFFMSSDNVDLRLLFDVMMCLRCGDDLFLVMVFLIGYLIDVFDCDEE